MNKSILIVLIFFIYAFFSIELYAQCGGSSGKILDTSYTYFPIHISGAINNDLSNVDQCVEIVSIKFTHSKIKNINAYLISPDSIIVQLIGNAVHGSFGDNTTGTKWDIRFFQDKDPVITDNGFPDIWNNNNFKLFGNYKGSYKPYIGKLEDFDGGINGTWLLAVEDKFVFDNDKSKIKNFELKFCDDTGITCEICVPDAGVISIETHELCEGDYTDVDFFDIVFSNIIPDKRFYSYQYIVSHNDTIILMDTLIDISSLSTGLYSICGFSFSNLNNQQSFVGVTIDSLRSLIDDNIICGALTLNCESLTILDVQNPNRISVSLCKGESYLYNDVKYDSSGLYYINDNIAGCDDITILEISSFSDHQYITTLGGDILDCNKPIVLLTINNQIDTAIYQKSWFTDTGHFNYDSMDKDTVEISRAGNYYYTWTDGTCIDTIEITIKEKVPLDQIDIIYEYYNCDSIKLYYTAESDLTTTKWILPGNLVYNNIDTIYIVDHGSVTLQTRNEDGCIGKTTELIPDPPKNNYMIVYNDLSCGLDSSSVFLTSELDNIDYSWIDSQNQLISDTSFFSTKVGGKYYLLYNYNNCIFKDSILIENEGDFPLLLSSSIDSISCHTDSVQLVTDYNISSLSYEWLGPFGFVSFSMAPYVHNEGVYYLSVMTELGCVTLDSFIVNNKSDKPQIIVGDNTINCGSDSIKVDLDISGLDLKYNWNGPAGFHSELAMPYINIPGRYTIEVYNINCSTIKEIYIDKEQSEFSISILADSINCINSPIDIMVSSSSTNLTKPNWQGPNNYSSEILNLSDIIDGGWYYINVEDENSCIISDSIHIINDISIPIISAGVDTGFNCTDEPLILNGYSNIIDNAIIQWTNDNTTIIENSNSLNPTISANGSYYLQIINKNNGCEAIDTIFVSESSDHILDIGIDTLVSPGAILLFDWNNSIKQEQVATIDWSSNVSLPCNSCEEFDLVIIGETEVSLTIIDIAGCIYTASRVIKTIDTKDIYIPTICSYGSDESLEFHVDYLPNVKKIESAIIFDNWGEQLYKRTNFTIEDKFHWNGIFRGKPVVPSVLVIIINYELMDGTRKTQIGNTTIIR